MRIVLYVEIHLSNILEGVYIKQDILPTEIWATLFRFCTHLVDAKEQATRTQYMIRNIA